MSQSNSGEGLRVAVVGATGAVGRDLLATLHKAGLPVAEVRLLASPRSAGETIEVQDRAHRVHVLGDGRGNPALEGVDLAFLAVPPQVAREVGPALAEDGVMVIDLSGGLADRAPLVVPALGATEALAEAGRSRVVACPSAPALAVATVLGALRDLVPSGVRGTVLLSAGVAGQAGVEELSAQVVALFNHKEAPRRVFPTGLAFDLLPAVGEEGPPGEDAAAAGWTDAERRLAAEVAVLAELPPARVAVGLAVAPLFSGVAASLHVQLEAEAPLAEVQTRLEQGGTVRWAAPLAGPRRLVGRAGLYVGRLRADPGGDGVHLWAIGDNLRFGATGNALAIATALWREGLI